MNKAIHEIGVYNEWGKLREAFVGIAPDDMVEPEYMPAFRWMGQEGIKITKERGGEKSIAILPHKIKLLRQQIESVVKVLKKHKVNVHRNIQPKYPEEVHFLDQTQKGLVVSGGADFFLVIGNNVILLNNLRYPFRRKQIYTVRPILEPLLQNSNARYVAMPPASPHYNETDPFLERGDIMLNGYDVYIGMSGNATNKTGIEWLKQFLGPQYRIYPIKLSKNILHLDTVFMLNRAGLLTYYPEFVRELPAPLKSWDKITVKAKPKEEYHFGANSLSIDENTIILSKEYDRLVLEYEKRKIEPILLPLGMSVEYGSGSRCLTGILKRDP